MGGYEAEVAPGLVERRTLEHVEMLLARIDGNVGGGSGRQEREGSYEGLSALQMGQQRLAG